MHYFHPKMYRNTFGGGGAPPGPAGELKRPADSPDKEASPTFEKFRHSVHLMVTCVQR